MCDGEDDNDFIANSLLNPLVKAFFKSTNIGNDFSIIESYFCK